MSTPKVADAKQTGVKARVLVDGPFGKINDIVVLSEDEIAAAGGAVDAHPKSVAYAEAQARKAVPINDE